MAEAIHDVSERARGAFVKINCGALPETLLESEIFRHKKGAFTGAVTGKMGRLRLAHKGTLYLTEIGDLPLPLQVKLLTFFDDKVALPLGSAQGFRADVRIIAATHRNLEKMVRDGRFRQDLLFRLNVVRLQLPPLRDRGDDIDLLLDHFMRIFCAKFGKKELRLLPSARRMLLDYPYPGNARELKNVVEYSINICLSEQVELMHLPAYIADPDPAAQEALKAADEDRQAMQKPSEVDAADLNWEDVERQLIVDTLLRESGRRTRAAAVLGWSRTTLRRKMKRYGLDA